MKIAPSKNKFNLIDLSLWKLDVVATLVRDRPPSKFTKGKLLFSVVELIKLISALQLCW